MELPGCRRGLRPDALLFKSGGFVRSKFKNRHQLSVTESVEFSDEALGFPGTPPPQATPPVHKDIPITTSKLTRTIDSKNEGKTETFQLGEKQNTDLTPTRDDAADNIDKDPEKSSKIGKDST